MKNYKAILFDVDNTILNQKKAFLDTLSKALDLVEKMPIVGFKRPSQTEILEVMKKNLHFEDLFENFVQGEYEGESLGKLLLEKYREVAPSIHYEATAGALDLVKDLKEKNILVGLVTNRVKMLEDRLNQAGFKKDDFICLSQPGKKEFAKPHPFAFDEALKVLESKGINFENVLMVGDHPDDFVSARGRGLGFIGVLSGYNSKDDFVKFGLEENLILDNLQEFDFGLLENKEEIIEKRTEKDLYFNSLKKISAADGRHCLITNELGEYFSEHALHKYRLLVQITHLIQMSRWAEFNLPKLSVADEQELMRVFYEFDDKSSQAIAEYDHFGRLGIGPLEHDVKSVEIYIREKLQGTKFEYLLSMIHFGFTSEDVSNFAYSLMLKNAIDKVWLPQAEKLTDRLLDLSAGYKKTPMLSRTHGQPASPTTFGKEMAVFLKRLTNELRELAKVKISGKMNGAVGNYNAQVVGYPKVNWLKYSQQLAQGFGFDLELLTNQRGPKNRICQIFQTIMRFNNVLKDLNIDLWTYVSKDLVLQKKIASHVGSSVMPHKINPWLIECSEGNIEVANALFEVYCRELEVSRLQRDLSDHDLERNYGLAIAYSLVALNYTATFLGRIEVNEKLMLEELQNNQQILSEAFQTIFRVHGRTDAYDLFKNIFRGQEKFSLDKVHQIIDGLDISEEVKNQLKDLKVENYLGLAEELVEVAEVDYKQYKLKLN